MNTNNIEVNTQNSIKISLDKIIYFDPFKIMEEKHDADYIFITHSHYDHMDKESIEKIKNDNTIIIAPKSIENDVRDILVKDYIFLNPNDEITIDNMNIKTIPAYNIQKEFHPRNNNWLGYIVNINNVTYFIAGDTDNTPEINNVKCDIAFIPIGGHYTMGVDEATALLKVINPKIVIPTHYGSIVGSKEDGKVLKNNLKDTNIIVEEKI